MKLDDFYEKFTSQLENRPLIEDSSVNRRNWKGKLSDSEMMGICLLFHYGHFTNFKDFYNQYFCGLLSDLFPNLIGYGRFNTGQERILLPLMLYLKYRGLGRLRGINYIDSTLLRVCHIKREKQHKVFKGLATKGKSTLG